jgi:hypothetical protein
MVHADTILESLITACKQSNFLPESVTYSSIVLDSGGDHSDVTPPVIEFTVDVIEKDQSRNTEKVGVETDGGFEIGYIYAEWFDLRVVAEITTVAGTKFTHRGLSQKLRKTLYQYDTHGMGDTLPDPDDPNQPINDVDWLFLDSVDSSTDFALSPSVRTRELSFQVGFTTEFKTSEFDTDITVLGQKEISFTANTVEADDGTMEFEYALDV